MEQWQEREVTDYPRVWFADHWCLSPFPKVAYTLGMGECAVVAVFL